MLEYNNSGKYTDLWALGCIIYQMLVGRSPFQAKTKDKVFQNVLERRLSYPHFLDSDARDLIDKLLQMIPENRLGMKSLLESNNLSELKLHPYFSDIDFEALASRTLHIPFTDNT